MMVDDCSQSMNFATEAETAMGKAIAENRGLTKCSIHFRRPEPRTAIEKALIRNGEIRTFPISSTTPTFPLSLSHFHREDSAPPR